MIKFYQSFNDFPLTVVLGEKKPEFRLSRWDGNTGLRFAPPDDEGFSIRGDKQRLVYKGRRRSHRFTILGDNAFEYDCIFPREPESNVITLNMEGAENFDFFRQPDFVPDPFMKGSYAVYKKETLIGEGTGKLCHIHRPEIIDARGWRCWGDLSIVDNCLYITIPEKWLSEAAYPVVVDPTIGTTTVGSQTRYRNEDNDLVELFFEVSLGVNRFLLPQTFNGTATAFVYAYERDYWGRCKPVLYADNNNVPSLRRSGNEGNFDIEVRNGKPASWRSTTFSTNTSITSGTNVWFGLFCDYFAPRFDFGQKCYWDYWDLSGGTDIPSLYPAWSPNWFYDFKISMYFTYSSAQNYTRVLTQGVRLTDSRRLIGNFKRTALETTRVNSGLSRLGTVYRECKDTVRNTEAINYLTSFFRMCVSVASNTVIINRLPVFIRLLLNTAGSEAGAGHITEFYRSNTDTVQVESRTNRGLLFFVRIISRVVFRDYLLSRFLRARQELVLKSCVCREIQIESKC